MAGLLNHLCRRVVKPKPAEKKWRLWYKAAMAKKFYTVSEAAKYLRVSRAAIQLAIKKKRLPAEWGTQTLEVLLIPAKDLKAYKVNPQKRRAGKKTA
jgi:excisionase family DNA binding protein